MKALVFDNSLDSRFPRKSLSKDKTRLAEDKLGTARNAFSRPRALPSLFSAEV